MARKFNFRYRIETTRLTTWDYGLNAAYFVTICTQSGERYFGEVVEAEMMLNEIGCIADELWTQIPNHFPFAKLGNYVIMPNHMHGIIVIDKMEHEKDDLAEDSADDYGDNRSESQNESLNPRLITRSASSPSTDSRGGIVGNQNPMMHRNLSRIIRWYKGRSTFEARKIHAEFTWLPRFHDHVIRNNRAFKHISQYIANNPTNWPEDRLNT